MNNMNKLFLMTTMTGTIITVSANNWISMWMGLELNMLAFIPLVKSKNKSSSEAAMIYFLTQSMSSMILLFSIISSSTGKEMQLFMSLGCMALLIKLGSAPLHMWFPEMMSKMSWNPCIILMTWQKLAPLMMLNNMSSKTIMYLAIISSAAVGAIGGMNQTSLRKIMSYSSINHLAWMMATSKIQYNWMIYWTIYSIMTIMICVFFLKYNMFFINNINNLNMSNTEKITYSMSMLSLGGLPPFLGFLPKWMVIQTLMNDSMLMLVIILIMSSLITLFFYMRSMTYMMIPFSMSINWNFTKPNTSINMMTLILNMSLPMILVMNLK
uniref:NADH-ubiquinone oxidoreductase chain 2 n=1 Tax=Microporus nigrita TaxID=1191099 RepID=A0A2K9YV26_9HEMI|nr:NADH dehydrogenase subunit 2 [Aethus nigritus]AUW38591.1 NADH dehydrogenase subunit 2 [Microporus nigrita]UCC45896.1 NADH dehydrogenase subunit 2 [Aethus nigritus]